MGSKTLHRGCQKHWALLKQQRTLVLTNERKDNMSFFEQLKDAVKNGADDLAASVSKFKNKKFMEAVVSVCAIVSIADGEVSANEKQKMVGFFKQSKELEAFDVKDVISFFNNLLESFEFDHEIGKGEAMKYIVRLKENPEAAQLAIRVGLAVAKSDNDFGPEEQKAVREICAALGLNAVDYQL